MALKRRRTKVRSPQYNVFCVEFLSALLRVFTFMQLAELFSVSSKEMYNALKSYILISLRMVISLGIKSRITLAKCYAIYSYNNFIIYNFFI